MLKLQELNEQLTNEKNEQSRLKKNREKLQKINQRLKQQTGIVNKKELKEDYDRRDKEKLELLDKIQALQDKHANLTNIINQAAQLQMKAKMAI